MIELIIGIAFLISIAFCSVFYFLRSMHMFQLNMYKTKGQFKWFGQNWKWLLLNLTAPLISMILFVLFLDDKFAIIKEYRMELCGCGDHYTPVYIERLISVYGIYLLAAAIILILNLIIFGRIKTKAKKPLVFTPRVIRMCITSVLFSVGYVFLSFTFFPGALHDYIISAIYYFDVNVIYIVSIYLFLFLSFILPLIAYFINMPVEKLINLRYINDAKRILRSHKNLITIGITGSYGKTSTKYFLNALLGEKFNTLMTPESYNTTMGVVKTIRNDLKATHEIFICEMGLMWLGDIAELCEIVQPNHAMLTSIGPQHLETMGSLENIINEKFEITRLINSENGGLVFLNYDNEFIRNREIDKKIIKYGLSENAQDYHAADITVSESGTDFSITVNAETTRFSTRLLGAHNVQNITGAIAVAHTLGVEMKDLIRLVKKLEPVPHRLQIINRGNDIIIDDAFNSNPVGARAALDVLKMFGGVKFLVTPGMVELGEKGCELNKELGMYAKDCCDFAVLIGEKQAPPIKAGLLENNFPEENIYVFKTLNEGLDFVNNYVSDMQKIILLENDLPDNY